MKEKIFGFNILIVVKMGIIQFQRIIDQRYRKKQQIALLYA
jgi:hypothetical protein